MAPERTTSKDREPQEDDLILAYFKVILKKEDEHDGAYQLIKSCLKNRIEDEFKMAVLITQAKWIFMKQPGEVGSSAHSSQVIIDRRNNSSYQSEIRVFLDTLGLKDLSCWDFEHDFLLSFDTIRMTLRGTNNPLWKAMKKYYLSGVVNTGIYALGSGFFEYEHERNRKKGMLKIFMSLLAIALLAFVLIHLFLINMI